MTIAQNNHSAVYFYYDADGRVIKKIEKIKRTGELFETQYHYDTWRNHLNSIRYPSGVEVHYPRDALGRVRGIYMNSPTSGIEWIVAGVKYMPFGPVEMVRYQYSNGVEHNFEYNDRYQLTKTSSSDGQLELSYRYDNGFAEMSWSNYAVGNVVTTRDIIYDDAGRLLRSDGNFLLGDQSEFDYDDLGNRTGGIVNYEYHNYRYYDFGDSSQILLENRISKVVSYSYDFNKFGDLAIYQSHNLYYDETGRFVGLSGGSNGRPFDYLHNVFGERVGKVSGANARYFSYGLEGELLFEKTGDHFRNYIYLDDRPVAYVDGQGSPQSPSNLQLYKVYGDNLGTPILITDRGNTPVWQAWYEPFGKAHIVVNKIESNIRFPGQYYDEESGFHYNYYRTYDPTLGRYLQSDPIGLDGGINTYAYVSNNPLSRIDPFGLKEIPEDFIGPPSPGDYRPSDMTDTVCGKIPPAPPGVDINDNINEANKHWNPWWFKNQVQNKGPWDYKQQGPLYEDFGNFHYGATGSGFGFGRSTLLREAGRAQRAAGTSRPVWGYPGNRFNPWGGQAPYGDDPNDQSQINRGVDYCECMSKQ